MKLTVTYEVSGEIRGHGERLDDFRRRTALKLTGPLRTGLDAANRQLADEDKKLRLRLVDVEVE